MTSIILFFTVWIYLFIKIDLFTVRSNCHYWEQSQINMNINPTLLWNPVNIELNNTYFEVPEHISGIAVNVTIHIKRYRFIDTHSRLIMQNKIWAEIISNLLFYAQQLFILLSA